MRGGLILAASISASHGRLSDNGPILRLNTCNNSLVAQQSWSNSVNATKFYVYPNGPGTQPMCIDIEGFDTNPNAVVYSYPCGRGSKQNEEWDASNHLFKSLQSPPTCLASNGNSVFSVITTAVCSSTDPLQTFNFDAGSGHIVHSSGLCVDAGLNQNIPYCSSAPQSTWPICVTTNSIDARAADIVSRLSLNDKFLALGTATPALNSVGLPSYEWWSEATHGLSGPGVRHDDTYPGATNTALPITTSCSFNRSMWKATGNLLGREGRAYFNGGMSGSTFWTPVINIVRDPRWGRNIESAGEDPFLSGQYAANFIQGFEHADEDPYSIVQSSTCCKHFVANELESWGGQTRHTIDVAVPEQDLVDSYLPSFQTCVEEGKATGIMCSYNAVNGVPSCASEWLLKTLLRETWNFDGYVTSDCDADGDVWNSHHYGGSAEHAAALILRAGTDVDCGGFMTKTAPLALANGNITIQDIDTVLTRLFKLRVRLGHFDVKTPLDNIGLADICSPAHKELARDGARQSMVLAKNVNNLLPISDASKIRNAVIIGPLIYSNWSVTYYGSVPCPYEYAVPADLLLQWVPNAKVIAGVPTVSSSDTSGIAAAAAVAAASDFVILSIGSDGSLEHEAHDRLVTNFSQAQLYLIGNITASSKVPVIAVVQSGGAMDITPLLNNPNIGAIIIAGQPSVQIVAAGDVIFGKTIDGRPVAPAARMSQMTYPASYVDQVSMFDFGMRPGPSAFPPGTNPGRTYRFYTGTPVLPFGYGLSYTSWIYTPVPQPTPPSSLSFAMINAAAEAHASTGIVGHTPASLQTIAADFYVNVTNSGSVDSDDVVLGFIVPPNAGQNGVPLQELFGFERVFVPAGQTVTVYLGAQGVRFTQAGKDGVRRALAGEYTIRFGVKETADKGMGFAEMSYTL